MAKLLEYVARENDADVPVLHVEGTYPLGRWVANQRAKYRRGETSRADIRALEALPGWNWSAWDRGWPQAMRLLRAFQKREGHARCPANHIEKGFPLGAWVARQRARYAAGRLSPTRTAEIDALADWAGNWKKTASDQLWDAKFAALSRFAAEHGHTDVPRKHEVKGLGLGIWVNSLRSHYNKGTLSQERVAALESVPGWKWARSREQIKAMGFERLQAYVAKHGDADVPRSYIDDTGYRLSEWVNKRRAAYKAGSMSQEEIAQIGSLPGWRWTPRGRS